MEIKTKFNFGDRVYPIYHGKEDYREECPICKGKGTVFLVEKHYDCPGEGCYGNGYVNKCRDSKWFTSKELSDSFVIQKIGIELHNPNNKKHSHNRSWTYVMAANSGNMLDENNCFISKEEAEKECIKRNLEIEINNK